MMTPEELEHEQDAMRARWRNEPPPPPPLSLPPNIKLGATRHENRSNRQRVTEAICKSLFAIVDDSTLRALKMPHLVGTGATVLDALACSATTAMLQNRRFVNTSLLEQFLARSAGKIALPVVKDDPNSETAEQISERVKQLIRDGEEEEESDD